jgi:hypothetical protein
MASRLHWYEGVAVILTDIEPMSALHVVGCVQSVYHRKRAKLFYQPLAALLSRKKSNHAMNLDFLPTMKHILLPLREEQTIPHDSPPQSTTASGSSAPHPLCPTQPEWTSTHLHHPPLYSLLLRCNLLASVSRFGGYTEKQTGAEVKEVFKPALQSPLIWRKLHLKNTHFSVHPPTPPPGWWCRR